MSSRGVNKWHGIGNVCADPEAKYLTSGGQVTNLTLACGDEYKDKSTRQKVDKTEFVRIVFFSKLAEIVAQYAKKGSKLYVEGAIRTRSWEQDGIKRYATEIVANEMQLLDSRNGGPAERQSAAEPSPMAGNPSSFDDFDDTPF